MVELNKKFIGILVGIFVATFVLGFFVFGSNLSLLGRESDKDYVIPGVPYFGLYSHRGDKSYMVGGDVSSAMTSVLDYWNPGENNYVEIANFFSTAGGHFVTGESYKEFITYSGNKKISVSKVHAEKVEDLKKYINPSVRTPLVFFHSIDPSQPENNTYHPAKVLIGIKETEKKMIVHDYWLGNNYEISFDDFAKDWEKMRSDERYSYTVIQPIELKEKVKELKSRKTENYPDRTQTMTVGEDMLKNMAMGRGAYTLNLNEMSAEYFLKVKSSSDYEKYFPPYLKVRMFSYLADVYSRQGKHGEAVAYAEHAVEMNHDLDKPSGDWPGYEVTGNNVNMIDRVPEPYKILGDIHFRKGDVANALESYQKALDIRSHYKEASDALDQVRIELARSGGQPQE